jgi:hypothetical protein
MNTLIGIGILINVILFGIIIWKLDLFTQSPQQTITYPAECKPGCNCFSNCRIKGNCCDEKCGDGPGKCNCDSDCAKWGNCCPECDGNYFPCKGNEISDVVTCEKGCNCYSNCKEKGNCCAEKCGDGLGECNCDSDCLLWGNCCPECDGEKFKC